MDETVERSGGPVARTVLSVLEILSESVGLHWNGLLVVRGYETVVNLIGATRAKTGLRIKAALDTRQYEAGVKISDESHHFADGAVNGPGECAVSVG